MSGSYYLVNFIKMLLKLNSQKLKISPIKLVQKFLKFFQRERVVAGNGKS